MKLYSPLAALALAQFIATIAYSTMAVLLLGIPCWFLSLYIKRKRIKGLVEAGALPPPRPPSALRQRTQLAVTVAAWLVWVLVLALVIWFRLSPHSRPIF